EGRRRKPYCHSPCGAQRTTLHPAKVVGSGSGGLKCRVQAKTPVQRDGKVEDFSRRTERAAWTWRLEMVIWAARSKYTKASTITLETSSTCAISPRMTISRAYSGGARKLPLNACTATTRTWAEASKER
ncbi:hypothetical protein NGA_0071202, partial [Nannochloropsis gaditana CCMP526]|uniref:uncharacterized protein n=1 Tax=Nannochloropsis gaditana (strain CCMP526) TaxID=1093141 RepID=UPI00029F6C97